MIFSTNNSDFICLFRLYGDEEGDADTEATTPPKRAYRTRGASRTTTATTKTTKNGKGRNTRAKNKARESTEMPNTDPCLSRLSHERKDVDVSNECADMNKEVAFLSDTIVVDTPEQIQAKSLQNINTTPACVKAKSRAGPGHVKNKVAAIEGIIDTCSPTVSPCFSPRLKQDRVPETPDGDECTPTVNNKRPVSTEDNTDTPINSKLSTLTDNEDTPVNYNADDSVFKTPSYSVKPRRSTCGGLKKLKRLSSQCKLSAVSNTRIVAESPSIPQVITRFISLFMTYQSDPRI